MFAGLKLLVNVVCIVTSISAIDLNEKVGPCMKNFDVTTTTYLTANEGVWFPQYRNRQANNKKYSCHTEHERLSLEDEITSIRSDSYYTKGGEVVKTPYTQTYAQLKRGVLIDDEEFPGIGKYQVKNFVINITPDYRVRYVCAEVGIARKKDGPVVYIETRSMTPSLEIIKKAVSDIKKKGIRVTLDRINQKGCKRPLNGKGYIDYNSD